MVDDGHRRGCIARGLAPAALVLAVVLGLGQTALCPAASANPPVYQGDLVLDGSNVTTVSGRLDINGSLILRGSATLILDNAQINILQTAWYQHSITLGDPLDAVSGTGPSIRARNSTMGSSVWMKMELYGASQVSFRSVTTKKAPIFLYNASRLEASDSTLDLLSINNHAAADLNATHVQQSVGMSGASDLKMLNSRTDAFLARDLSVVSLDLSTISGYFLIDPSSVDCLIKDLEPGLVAVWEFSQNCSATLRSSGTIPEVVLRRTEVANWGFRFHGSSNAEIRNCLLREVQAWDDSHIVIKDTILNHLVFGTGTSTVQMLNSTCNLLSSVDQANMLLTDSASRDYDIQDLSTAVSKRHLEALVVDSQDRAVPQANVQAYHPNQTLAGAAVTDQTGIATLLLREWTASAAGRTPLQTYTVKASYATHQAQAELNISASQNLVFKLEGLTIPEQPGPWQAVIPAMLVVVLVLHSYHSSPAASHAFLTEAAVTRAA